MISKIKKWSEETGIFPIGAPEIDVQTIVNLCNNGLAECSLKEIEELITKSSAYNIYLKSMKGSLLARITLSSQELDQKIYSETQNVISEGTYLSKEEKKATVLNTFPKLQAQYDELLEIRMKYLRMRDVPQAIDVAINNLKMAYYRRVNEELKLSSGKNASSCNNQRFS